MKVPFLTPHQTFSKCPFPAAFQGLQGMIKNPRSTASQIEQAAKNIIEMHEETRDFEELPNQTKFGLRLMALPIERRKDFIDKNLRSICPEIIPTMDNLQRTPQDQTVIREACGKLHSLQSTIQSSPLQGKLVATLLTEICTNLNDEKD